ncbi:MAG: sensor histidine kinase [Gemmatimonadota bacterium]
MRAFRAPDIEPEATDRTRYIAAGLLGGAFVLATLTSLHLYLNWSLYGEEQDYATIWMAEAIEWSIWAMVVPLVWRIERRYGTAAGSLLRAGLVHLGVFLVLYAVQNVVMASIGLAVGLAATGPGGFAQLILLRAINHGPSAILIYSLIVAAAILVRVSATHSRQKASLEAELAEARLQYLRAQLQPHFLFNTLHGIAGLVRQGERDEAVKTIGLLGQLLRRALAADERTELELGEELSDLETYMDIQRMRFGDRLRFTTDVPRALERVRVPGLLLQPLVENSLRHGFGAEGGGHIHISAVRENGAVAIQVVDDGSGFNRPFEEGVGLGNLRARLEAMYDGRARLECGNDAGGGARVLIRLPIGPAGAMTSAQPE